MEIYKCLFSSWAKNRKFNGTAKFLGAYPCHLNILFLILVFSPLEKLSVYIEKPFSFTLKFYFFLVPALIVSLFLKSEVINIVRSEKKLFIAVFFISVAYFLSGVSVQGVENNSSIFFRIFSLSLCIMVCLSVKSLREVEYLLKGFVISGIVNASYGYVQSLQYFLGCDTSFPSIGQIAKRLGYSGVTSIPIENGIPRLTGFNYDPNLFGVSILIAMTCLIVLLLNENINKKLGYLSFVFLCVPFFSTKSRACLASLVIMILYFILLSIKKNTKTNIVKVLSIELVIGFIVVNVFFGLVYNGKHDFLCGSLYDFADRGPKADHYRMTFINGAFMLGLEKPIFGNGINTFENVFLNSKYNPYNYLKRANPHSFPMRVFYEVGLIGIVAYAWFIFYGIWHIHVSFFKDIGGEHKLGFFALALLVSLLLLHNLVNDYFHVEFFILFFGFVLSLSDVLLAEASGG